MACKILYRYGNVCNRSANTNIVNPIKKAANRLQWASAAGLQLQL